MADKVNKEETKVVDINDKENVQEKQEDKRAPEEFERGNLTLICSSCGNEEILEVGIKNGIRFNLPTIEGAEVKLACSSCKNSLSITFRKSNEEEIKKGEERDAKIKEEEKAKIKEMEDKVEELKKEEEQKEENTTNEDIPGEGKQE